MPFSFPAIILPNAVSNIEVSATAAITESKLLFANTGGHTHTGAAATGTKVSHTSLNDIGTNTHAQIDTHVGAASPHSAHLRRNRVTWTGNDTVNRAIAHGLTTVYFILVSTSLNSIALILQKDDDNTWRWDRSGGSQQAVTAPDGTNFYVGNATSYGESANDSSYSYAAEIIGV